MTTEQKIIERGQQLVGAIEEAMAKDGIPNTGFREAETTRALGMILGTLWCMASDLLPTMDGDPLPPAMLYDGDESGMVMLTPLTNSDVRIRRATRKQIPAILSNPKGLRAAGYMNESWALELDISDGKVPVRHGPVSEDDRRISVVFFNFATEHIEGTIRCKIEEGNGRKLQEEAKVMFSYVDGEPMVDLAKVGGDPDRAPPSMWPRGSYGELDGLEMVKVDA